MAVVTATDALCRAPLTQHNPVPPQMAQF